MRKNKESCHSFSLRKACTTLAFQNLVDRVFLKKKKLVDSVSVLQWIRGRGGCHFKAMLRLHYHSRSFKNKCKNAKNELPQVARDE